MIDYDCNDVDGKKQKLILGHINQRDAKTSKTTKKNGFLFALPKRKDKSNIVSRFKKPAKDKSQIDMVFFDKQKPKEIFNKIMNFRHTQNKDLNMIGFIDYHWDLNSNLLKIVVVL